LTGLDPVVPYRWFGVVPTCGDGRWSISPLRQRRAGLCQRQAVGGPAWAAVARGVVSTRCWQEGGQANRLAKDQCPPLFGQNAGQLRLRGSRHRVLGRGHCAAAMGRGFELAV